MYKAPKKRKIDMVTSKSESASVIPDFQDIPPCIDNLPAGVDISILVNQNGPRQPATSVSTTISDIICFYFHCWKNTLLLTWMEEDRDDFLCKLLRLEGRNGVTACSFCNTGPAIYRCDDCFGIGLYCKRCIVSRHTSQPVHLIKVSVL